MNFSARTANTFLSNSTLPPLSNSQARCAYRRVCKVMLPSRVGVNASPEGMPNLSRNVRPPVRKPLYVKGPPGAPTWAQ